MREVINQFLNAHYTLMVFVSSILLLLMHLFSGPLATSGAFLMVIGSLSALGMAFSILLYVNRPEVPLAQALSFLFLYGASSFVLLSEWLSEFGLARWLTKRRGEQWIKELDYIYLLIGALGVAFSMNQLDFLTNRLEGGQALGPFLLTTAIVVRVIKTRAEIGQWNKLTTPALAAPSAPPASPPPSPAP